jgi:nucleoside-triphosphatase THEP1
LRVADAHFRRDAHVDPGPSARMTPAAAPASHRIVLLTGGPDAGKTSLCRRVVDEARLKGLRVSGLLTEAGRLSSGRIVQTVLNLRTGERRRLADYVGVDEGEPIGRGVAGRFSWTFVSEAVRWGRHEVDRWLTGETDLLVIDQLGPLELLAGSGWVNAVKVLEEGRYGLALVVVNPLVVEQLRERLEGAEVEEVDAAPEKTAALRERLARLALESRLGRRS